MKFFKKELCEKLQKLGCVSETPFAYYHNWPSPIYDIALYPKPHEQILICNAFSIYDFLSDEEYAEENCKKLFIGNWKGEKGQINLVIFNNKRNLIISTNQEAYIGKAVDENLKRSDKE